MPPRQPSERANEGVETASGARSLSSSTSLGRRLALAGLVLVSEYVATTFCVDLDDLPVPTMLSSALSWGSATAPLLVVLTAAAVVFARERLSQLRIDTGLTPLAWAPHVFALALFAASTYSLWTWPSGALVALWLAMAALLAATALGAVVPGSAILGLLRPLGPALCLAVAAWAAGTASQELWPVLQQVTLGVVAELAYRTWHDVVYVPEVALVGTQRFRVVVAPMCAGLEGLGLMSVLLGAYLWWRRRQLRLTRAIWVLPLALVAVWVANAFRIFALIAVGSHVSPSLALGAFHSKAGWVVFCLIAVGTALWLERGRYWQRTPPPVDDNTRYENPVAAYVVPLLCVVGTALVTETFAESIDWLYGVRLVPAALALAYFGGKLGGSLQEPWWAHRGAALGTLVGVAAFGVWWLLTAPAWLPTVFFLTARPGPEANAALIAPLVPLTSTTSVLWIALRAAGAILVVPVVEELAFRGFLLRRLVQREFDELPFTRFDIVAVLVSSVIFGLLHGAWVAGTACGVMYAWAQQRTGGLTAPVVAHSVTNALLALYVFATGQWWQWL